MPHKIFVQTGPTMSEQKGKITVAKEQTRKQDGGAHENVTRGRASSLSQNDKGRCSASKDLENKNRNTEEHPHPPSNEETWSCDTCELKFADENDKLLSCEYCGHHRCVSCLGMTKTVYKAISGRPDLPWFCSACMQVIDCH